MEEQYLELFKSLVRLKTTHDKENKKEHETCREILIAEAEKRELNYKIIQSETYPSILVGQNIDNLSPELLLLCHLDVVAASEKLFEPKIENDRFIARGASDMKFAVPVFFDILDQLGTEKDKVLLAFTFDEEIGGFDGTNYLLNTLGLKPNVCFLPDGGDNFQIEADEKGLLLFSIKTTGKSAHGSRPWLGESAIEKSLEIYSDLRKRFPFITSPKNWTETLTLGKIEGGEATNQVPNHSKASFDLRFVEGETVDSIKKTIKEIVGDRGILESIVEGDNFHLNMDIECSQLFQASAKKYLNRPLPIFRSEGGSDARFFTKHHIPVIICKPICGGHHSDYEWIDLKNIKIYTDILIDFTKRLILN